MKKKLLLLTALLIFSCSSDDSNDNNSNDINSDFVGTWTAIYSGDGSGSAEVIVSSSGLVSGYADEIDPISGTVTNEGSINATSEMLAMVIQRNGQVLYKLMGLVLALGLEVGFLALGLLLNNKLTK